MREPLAIEGSYDDNPLHAELLEIAAMARHDFLLDTTLTKTREISGVFAGSPVEAHAAGVDFLRRTSLERVDALADLVITSAGGNPLDLNLYQTVKGVTAAAHLVKPGGRILILGACSEGAGSREFTGRLRSYTTDESFLAELAQDPVEIDQWQLEKLALTGVRHPLFFYIPGVAASDLGGLASRTYTTPQAAVRAALEGLAPDARIALIPEGPYVFARVAAELSSRDRQLLGRQIPGLHLEPSAAAARAPRRIRRRRRSRHHHLVSRYPVDRCAHAVCVDRLQRLKDTQEFIYVSSQLLRVVEQCTNQSLRIDCKHGAHGSRVTDRLVHQAIGLRHLLIQIRDHRKLDGNARHLLEISQPRYVGRHRVDRDADQLYVQPFKLVASPCKLDELGRAHRREVRRMGK